MVLVIDPEPLYRFALQHAIERSLGRGVALAASVADVARAVGEERDPGVPEVTVLSASAQPSSGLLDVRGVLAALPETRLLVIMPSDADRSYVYGVLEAGAVGCMLRSAEPDELAHVVDHLVNGETCISSDCQRLLAEEIQVRAAGRRYLLTTREAEVLTLAGQGLSYARIAEQLYLSHATVKTHLANAYAKLGASDRTTAVLRAINAGLLDPADILAAGGVSA